MFASRCGRWRVSSSLTRRFLSTLSDPPTSPNTLALCNPTDASGVVRVAVRKGYNVADVVKAAAYGPVHLVRPFEDHLFLHYYAPADAAARCRSNIKLPLAQNPLIVHPVPRTELPAFPTKRTLSLFLDAAAIARLGYAHASRSLKIHWNGPARLTEKEMLSTLTKFGYLENAQAYDDRDGEKEVLNVVFFDERASSAFFQSVIDNLVPGLEDVTIRYSLDPSVNKKRITEGKEEIRRVDIYLREAEIPMSTGTLLERVNHLLASELQVGERVPVITRNNSKISLFFLYPFYAKKFYELALDAAEDWGATLQLTGASTMNFFLKKAILAGACRTLKLRLDREVSEEELHRDFSTFIRSNQTATFGDLRIEMQQNEALIEYNDIYHALKAVHGLTSGLHTLGERYTGMEILFHNSVLPTIGSAIVSARLCATNCFLNRGQHPNLLEDTDWAALVR